MKKNDKLDRRLEAYSLSASAVRAVRRGLASRQVRYSAAAAAGAALAGAGAADAALIVSPNEGFSVSIVSSTNSAGFDVDGDGNNDLFAGVSATLFSTPGSSSSSTFPGFLSQYNSAFIANPNGLGFGAASNMFAQSQANRTFTSTYTSFFSTFPASFSSGPGTTTTFSTFFGFAFFAGSNATATPNLGWLHAIVEFAPGFSRLTFDQVVYETVPGQPVHVGVRRMSPVPEPSSVALMGLGLLALGGRGLREWRRRKKKQDA
ncbi:MAG: PEP-CTERM sorting domain-containing protein [Bryobacterales bacterium]